MSPPVTVIVDDQSKDIKYLCPVDQQTVAGTYINNTWTSVKSPQCGSDGWFQYTFNGTRILVAASSPNDDQLFSVMIDDGPRMNYTGSGYYESPVLSDDRHTITYYAPSGASDLSSTLDYLAVTAGRTTFLNGHTLIVDDSDDTVTYGGGWTTESPIPLTFDFSTSIYQSTTHWSHSIGDTIEYNFLGDSIALYGIVANLTSSARKNISMTYILDGVPTERGIPAGTLEGLPKAALFHSSNLTAGQHTLIVNVSDIASPQAIGFDFFLYNSTASDVTASAASANPSATRSRAGAIAGGVIGALLLLGLLFFALLQLSKRRKCGVHRWFPLEKLQTPQKPLPKVPEFKTKFGAGHSL
jgi:hypothetical protein